MDKSCCKCAEKSVKTTHRDLKPGEKLRFALIGCGIQGRDILRLFIKNGQFDIVAVCDVDAERVAEGKRMVDEANGNNACKAVADFRDIIADDSIDAVAILTPDHWHAYIAVEALKHGKDVFCEKPLTFSIDEAKKVIKAEKKYGRVFQVDAWQRSWDIFWASAMVVRNKCLGNIRYVDANFGYRGKKLGGPSHPIRFYDVPENAATEGAPNPNVNWDMWLGPAKIRPYSDQLAPRGVNHFYPMFWRFDDDFGTGYCGDWGAHHLDIAQWGMDCDSTGPYKLILSEEPYSTDLFHGGRRQYGSKLLFKKPYGDIEVYHGPFGVWGTVFYCDNGIVAVNRGKIAVWEGTGLVKPTDEIREKLQDVSFMPDKIVVESVGKDYGSDTNMKLDERLAQCVKTLIEKYGLEKAKVQLPRTGQDTFGMPAHVNNFVECCYSRKTAVSPASVGGRTAILCGLFNLSYIYDTGFEWDPVKNEFANGTGKGISIKREYYRNGWDVIV